MSFDTSASSTMKAYQEWMIKVSEIFAQSRTRLLPPGPPRPSRHFALAVSERFEFRSHFESLETSGFFENQKRVVLEFGTTGSEYVPVERVVFQFYPLRDLPPTTRPSPAEERRALTLPRRLSVAARSAFCASRLLPAFGDFSKKLDFCMQLRFEAVGGGGGLGTGGMANLEISSIPCPMGVLKLVVFHQRGAGTGSEGAGLSPGRINIDEYYVNSGVHMDIEEISKNDYPVTPSPMRTDQQSSIEKSIVLARAPINNPAPPSLPPVRSPADSLPSPPLKDISPISPFFNVSCRSEISSQFSPTSRDLLTDIWPISSAKRAVLDGSLGNSVDCQLFSSAGGTSADEVFSDSDSETSQEITNFFDPEDLVAECSLIEHTNARRNSLGEDKLGRILVSVRSAKLMSIKQHDDLIVRWNHLLEVNKHLTLL